MVISYFRQLFMRILFSFIFVLFSAHLFSQARKYSNEFLNIGVGAKALGMANANIASSEGVESGYWNPAGLLKQKSDMQVGLMHSEYFAGIAKYDYAGISRRIDSVSVAAISLVRFGVDNIPNTLDLVDANGNIDYNRVTKFNTVDFAAIMSYARLIPKLKGLELGGNFKIIRRNIGNFAGAWGFGLDAGAKYNYNGWQFAAMAKDVTGTFNAWSFSLNQKQLAVLEQTGNKVPTSSLEITNPSLILGLAKKFYTWQNKISILGEVNFINTFDGQRNTVISSRYYNAQPSGGIEIGFKGTVFLRGGVGNIQRQLNDRATVYITTAQPNFGAGIKYKMFTLDYALTDIGDHSSSLYSNIFSLKIDLNNNFLKQLNSK